MKKIFVLLALALVAGASFSSVAAKDKKEKKAAQQTEVKETVAVKTPVNITSERDSVSYAAGQAFTRGLDSYIKQQFGVTDSTMTDFMCGLKEGLAGKEDPKVKARAAGMQIASMVKGRMLPDIKKQFDGTCDSLDVNLFERGFCDAVEADASILSVEESAKYFEGKSKSIKEEKNASLKAEGQKWLAENAKKEGVKTTASGLQYKVITEGNGPVATKDQTVVVKYEGKLLNGKIFDSSYTRNPQTTEFKPTQVIPGWTEALTMMPKGSTWELYIPYSLAYGERGAGADIPPYATLIFKVELVDIKGEAKKEEAKPATTAAKTTATKAPVKKAVTKKK